MIEPQETPITERPSGLPKTSLGVIDELFPEQAAQRKQRQAEERKAFDEDPAGRVLRLHERTRTLTAADAWKSITDEPGRLVPYISAAVEAEQLGALLDNARALEAGTATPEQESAVLEHFQRAYRDKTLGYKVVDILGQLPAFAGEFAIGAGVGKMAVSGGKQTLGALAREATEQAIKNQAKRGIRKGIERALTFGAEVGVQTAFNEAASIATAAAMGMDEPGGRITADAYRRQLESAGVHLTPDEAGQMRVAFESSIPDFMEVLPQAITSQLIENVSERSGGLATGAMRRIPVPAKVAALQADVLKWWRGKNPDAPVADFFKQIAKKSGWHGPAGEWAEERFGAALRAATPGMSEEWGDVFPAIEDQAAELVAFSVPGAVSLAAQGVDRALQGDAAELDGPTDQTGENLRNEPQESAAGAPSEEARSSEIQVGSELEADEIQPATVPDAESAAGPNQAEFAQAGADVPADTAPAVEAPEATDAPATPQTPQEPPRAIRVPAEQAGQLPASMRVSRPQDPLMPDEGGEAEVPIGDELRGRLEDPPEPLPGEPVNKPQIISAMAKAVEAAGGQTPFKTGKVMKGALGFYRPHTDVIRVKTANDLTTAAHEMGHALDRHIFGKIGAVAKQVGPAEKRELLRIGRELYGDTRPTGGYRSEGFAEWMNWWTTDPQRAREKAPKFTSWFEDTFLPANEGVAAELAKVRDYTTRWRGQGSAERVRQSIVDPASPSARAKRTLGDIFGNLVGRLVEEGAPYRSLTKAAEAQGAKLRPSQDPYKVFTALRMTDSAIVDRMVHSGMRDFAGNRTGPPLMDVRPLIEGKRSDFLSYLIARRARALLTDPRGPRNPGITLEDAEQVIKQYETPQFAKAAEKLYEWREGVLSYAAQSSPTLAKTVEAIRARDPGDAVPLFREMDDAARSYISSGGRKGGAPVKRLKGSGRRIKDPLQSTLSDAQAWVKAAHKRAVIDAVIGLAKHPGMGHVIEKVPVDQVPVASRKLADLLDQARKQVEAAGGTLSVEAENVDLEEQLVTLFGAATSPKGHENIVPVYEGGGVSWYEVQPDLYKALSGMDVFRLHPLLEVFAIPARLARMGHTGLRPAFALVTNPLRDPQTMYTNSRADGSGAALFASWGRAMVDALKAATGNEEGTSEAFKLFLRMGGEMAQPLGQDMAHTRRSARRLAQSKTVHTLDPRNAFDTLRGILQFPEAAPRVAELERVAKDMGIDLESGEQVSWDQSIELMIAARQVTTDFTAAGSFMRMLNRMVPFLTAAISGPRSSARAFRRNPARFLTRAVSMITVPTLALYWLNKDEDWWKELPAREKFSYWHVPVDMPGHEGERIRIPRTHETGGFFAALPEMLLDSWYNEDPDAASEWMDHMQRTLVPDVVPTAAREIYEQARNRDSFFDSPIVPMREERKPAEEQYDEFTSRAARHIGELFGASPRRIDHAMRSTFGGVSTDLLAATNLLPDPLKLGPEGNASEWEMADLPVLGRLFARGGEFGTRSKNVDKLFEALDEAQTLQASDRHEETRQERELRLQLSDAAKAVTNLYAVRRLTPDKEKRRSLTVEIAGIAREAMELHREETVRRSKMQLERKRAERLKERAERRAKRSESR